MSPSSINKIEGSKLLIKEVLGYPQTLMSMITYLPQLNQFGDLQMEIHLFGDRWMDR